MKKLCAIFLFVAGFAFASQAQEATHNRQAKKEQMVKAKEELKLSAEQQTKWNNIDEDFKTRIKAIRKNDGLGADEKKSQLRSLTKERMEKIRAVLTAEQQEKWNQMRKEAHHKKASKRCRFPDNLTSTGNLILKQKGQQDLSGGPFLFYNRII